MNSNRMTTKPHYAVLDALRGVAAIMVVAFHLFEAHAANRFSQIINHGYLAVDFFFLLSGFVIGYAYDDRWTKMSVGDFIKRRLIRLQPMVVMGAVIGAVCFYFQASSLWPAIGKTPVIEMLLVMLIGFTMIPLPPSMDIRGWSETYPLNGPAWSLFYEYIVNLLYGLFIRRFSNKALAVLVFLSAALLVHYTLTGPTGDVIGGWSLEPAQLRIGFTRVLYPFFAGLLLFRTARFPQLKNAFLWSSLLVIATLAMPRIGDAEHLWMNGLYESLCIIFVFPLIVFLGTGGEPKGKWSKRTCRFLGDISYPIYITHYPLIYIYTAWVYDKKVSLRDGYRIALLVLTSAILIAYACLKFYDEPVRRWLKKKILASTNDQGENEETIRTAGK